MIIRDPTDRDADELREVESLAVVPLRKIYRPTQAAIARKAARAHARHRLVCECDGRVVGTVQYEVHPQRLHILGPMVHPTYQRKGIARLLIDRVAVEAREMGKPTLSLNTCKQTGNVRIFTKLAFAVVRESVDQDDLVENLTNERLIDVYMERQVY